MGEIAGTTRLVGLIGDPVSGSLSPRMQNAAFAGARAGLGRTCRCRGRSRARRGVAGLVALGFAGANVTTPHKTSVIPFCDELEESAERAAP